MNIAEVEFRYRERVAEILIRGEWANDPERELAEVVIQLLDRQATAKKKQRERLRSWHKARSACATFWPGRGCWRFTRDETAAPPVCLLRTSGEAGL